MQFNGHTNSQDIVSQIDFYCATTSEDYAIEDKTRNVNIAYHEAAQIIQSADGTWQWDDSNNTTLPFGVTDIVANQRDYTLDDAMLEIERVEVKDTGGNWVKLKPIDQADIVSPYLEFHETAGTPEYYDKVGNSLYLFPAANFSQVESMRVQFKRGAVIFDVADTDTSPGFIERFHDFLALSAAIAYCAMYKQDRVAVLIDAKERMRAEMFNYYNRRAKDEHKRFKVHLPNLR